MMLFYYFSLAAYFAFPSILVFHQTIDTPQDTRAQRNSLLFELTVRPVTAVSAVIWILRYSTDGSRNSNLPFDCATFLAA